MSHLKELPEDYWDKVARQTKFLDRLRKRKEQEDEQRQILLARRTG